MSYTDKASLLDRILGLVALFALAVVIRIAS